jgi:hypothetical protein
LSKLIQQQVLHPCQGRLFGVDTAGGCTAVVEELGSALFIFDVLDILSQTSGGDIFDKDLSSAGEKSSYIIYIYIYIYIYICWWVGVVEKKKIFI